LLKVLWAEKKMARNAKSSVRDNLDREGLNIG